MTSDKGFAIGMTVHCYYMYMPVCIPHDYRYAIYTWVRYRYHTDHLCDMQYDIWLINPQYWDDNFTLRTHYDMCYYYCDYDYYDYKYTNSSGVPNINRQPLSFVWQLCGCFDGANQRPENITEEMRTDKPLSR